MSEAFCCLWYEEDLSSVLTFELEEIKKSETNEQRLIKVVIKFLQCRHRALGKGYLGIARCKQILREVIIHIKSRRKTLRRNSEICLLSEIQFLKVMAAPSQVTPYLDQ